MTEPTFFRLRDIAKSVQNKLSAGIQNSFWVKAELNEMTINQVSGNCYVNLIDKENTNLMAQFRGLIWKADYQRINRKFMELLKEPLKAGIGILFQTRLSYHPVFGLSLEILDIDPSFSLGELEKEKKETIDKLKKEGIFNKNKELEEPMLVKRLAIISSKSSKGYSDFMKIIFENDYGYGISPILFPSILQGDPAIQSIRKQLAKIKKVKHHFDAVAIIRGGGDEFGMTCYNNFQLAKDIASFPLPVYTGIGHSTNESVSEMVSFYNAITPTQLGEYVLYKFHVFAEPILKFQTEIWQDIKNILNQEKRHLLTLSKTLGSSTFQQVKLTNSELLGASRQVYRSSIYNLDSANKNQINAMLILNRNLKYFYVDKHSKIQGGIQHLSDRIREFINRKKQGLELYDKTVEILNPQALLKKGYSITLDELKHRIDLKKIKIGDKIITQVVDGEIESEVLKIFKSTKDES